MALVEERLERRSKQLHDERRVPVTRLGVVDLRNAFCAGRNHRSHIANRKQDKNNDNKLAKLASTHIFYPFAIETAGTWHVMAIEQALMRNTLKVKVQLRFEPGPRDWQAYRHYHRRPPGDNIPFPTLFSGSAKRKCGFFPQHHGHRVNCRCNHNFVCIA